MNKSSLIALMLSFIIAVGSLLYVQINKKRTAYIDLTDLYDGFTLKKELEQNLGKLQLETKYLLDSLSSEMDLIQQYSRTATNVEQMKRLNLMEREYALKSQKINEDYQELLARYEDQIWQQLNQYVADFSDKKGYAYLIGSDGRGVIMGGDQKYNVTKNVLIYANERYHGEAK